MNLGGSLGGAFGKRLLLLLLGQGGRSDSAGGCPARGRSSSLGAMLWGGGRGARGGAEERKEGFGEGSSQ